MASIFINNFINEIQEKINYWFNNYVQHADLFAISPLDRPIIVNPNILNHNLTSCCPSPRFPSIEFGYFPEPYYGNPDDDIEKLAVVLFYNPGPQKPEQHINARGIGTFYNNYLDNDSNYFQLSSNLDFCDVTINGFWNIKINQLDDLLNFLIIENNKPQPLFLDLIPWHSQNFSGINMVRFVRIETLKEFKRNVIFPAIFNAKNTLVSNYVNQFSSSTNKIVFFAVGARYSNNNILSAIGFSDFTNFIPEHPEHTLVNGTIISGNNSKIKIWKSNADLFDVNISNIENITNSEVYILNLWTPNVGMNIPRNISETIRHIFHNI
jgi:hypothetical protein